MAIVTVILRGAPFIIFPEGKPVPPIVDRISRILPYAVIGMLVVYCLKGISFAAAPFGLPELISVAFVSLLYVWKRSTLISIAAGTVCYMLLIQVVFK